MKFQTLIDVTALQQLSGDARLVIVDCRFDLMAPDKGWHDYLAAHIPGARYADLNRDLSAPVTARSGRHPLPPPDVLAARFGSFGIDAQSQVVVYDEVNGSIAARLWWLLRWLGHADVAVLEGGIRAWIAAGGALQSGDGAHAAVAAGGVAHAAVAAGAGAHATVAAGGVAHAAAVPGDRRFEARIDPTAVVTAAELEAALADPRRLLVDARAPERFAGTVEPLDPVAGHVAGAVNHPFSSNLAADGRFLPAGELRRRWLDRLGPIEPADVIVMCGSGVTACHNLLSMEVAGLTGAKLYAGSWSEWIRDPERAIVRAK